MDYLIDFSLWEGRYGSFQTDCMIARTRQKALGIDRQIWMKYSPIWHMELFYSYYSKKFKGDI